MIKMSQFRMIDGRRVCEDTPVGLMLGRRPALPFGCRPRSAGGNHRENDLLLVGRSAGKRLPRGEGLSRIFGSYGASR
jgi:hypothetical protein